MIPQPSTVSPARKPGRGRPALIEPRRTNLPRINASAHAHLSTYATRHGLTLADAIQVAIFSLPVQQRPTASKSPRAASPS